VCSSDLALGVTQFLPIDDRHMYSKNYLLDNLASLLGGRAAEILALGDITTGASNDIEKATEIAHKMVCEWGMSEKVGTIQYSNPHDSIFLGREITQRKDFSEETARLIDSEVKKIVDEAMQRALDILKNNLDKLNKMANYLLERETLDSEDIDRIMRGEELEPLKKDNEKNEVKNEEVV
jgi:cell division protease FtsH